jgi:hypothetical protein
MYLAYSLNQDLSCEKLCGELQRLFQKLKEKNIDMTNKVLTINLVDIVSTDDNLIPKLEYKQE